MLSIKISLEGGEGFGSLPRLLRHFKSNIYYIRCYWLLAPTLGRGQWLWVIKMDRRVLWSKPGGPEIARAIWKWKVNLGKVSFIR